jgi:hypothetical protein
MMTREIIMRNQKMNILIQSELVIVLVPTIEMPTTIPVSRNIRVSLPYWIDAHTLCRACSLYGYILRLPTAEKYRPKQTMLRIPETFTQVNSAM